MTPREMVEVLQREATAYSVANEWLAVCPDHILAIAQWVWELEAEIERHHRDFDRWEQDAVNERKRAEKAEAALMKSSEFCPGEFPCEASMHASEYLDRMTRAEAQVEKLKSVLRRALLSDACRWAVIPQWHVDARAALAEMEEKS